MNTWRERLNLFYYNIFRFERYTQYLISAPMHGLLKFVGLGNLMARRSGKEDWDKHILNILNDPKGGISLHIAGLQITAHLAVLLNTPWNIICGLLQIKIDPWFYGFLVFGALAVVASNYVAPGETKIYLKDFRRFESMPKAWKRKSAALTFLIVLGIWSLFLLSFIYNLRSSVQ